MITPNLVLKKLIEHYLPTQIGKYHQGDVFELHAFMRIARDFYPLVWFEMSNSPRPIIDAAHGKHTQQRVRLILATRTEKAWLNDKRYLETFQNVLFPLYDNVKKLVIENQYVELIGDFSRFDHPSFQVNVNENEVTDFWDVIAVEFEARFFEVKCLN